MTHRLRLAVFVLLILFAGSLDVARAQPMNGNVPTKSAAGRQKRPAAATKTAAPTKTAAAAPAKTAPTHRVSVVKQGDVVGILEVSTHGVSEIAAEKFEVSLEQGLKLHGFKVANRQKMQDYLRGSEYLAGCFFGPCLRDIFRRTRGDVELVLVARIQGEGSTYRFLISLVDTKSGTPTAQIPTTCTVCTVEEAIAAATLAVVELVAGTGESSVLDPRGATGDAMSDKNDTDREPTPSRARRLTKTMSIIFAAGGLIAGASSVVFFAGSNEGAGFTLAGTSLGLLSGSGTLWLISRQF